MARAGAVLVVVLAAASVLLAPWAATAQTSSCDDALPPALAGNYSGLACRPVWNNFVLRVSYPRRTGAPASQDPRAHRLPSLSRSLILCVSQYAQGKDNVLRVVISSMYSTGWVGMGFSRDGLMVGSSAMVGWIGRKGLPHVKQFALRGKTSGKVVVNRGFLVSNSNNHDHTVVVQQAKIYLAFQLRFQSPLRRQQVLLAFGNAIPVNDRLTEHQGKTSFTFDFTTGSF